LVVADQTTHEPLGVVGIARCVTAPGKLFKFDLTNQVDFISVKLGC